MPARCAASSSCALSVSIIRAASCPLSVRIRSISRPILPYPMIAAFICFVEIFVQRYELFMNLNAGERTIVFRNFVYLPDKSFPVCAIFSNSGTTGPPTAAGSGSRPAVGAADARTGARYPAARTGCSDGRRAYRHGGQCGLLRGALRLRTSRRDPAQTVCKLNFLLPGDIAVGSMTPVAEDAHARFHAREREYRYFIEPRKIPLRGHETWRITCRLDVGR